MLASVRNYSAEGMHSQGRGRLKRQRTCAADTIETETSSIRRIFIGPTGFRSGWSFTLYVALFALIIATGSLGARSLHFGELWSQVFGELGLLSAAVIAALIMSRIERRPWSAYGLPLYGALSRLFWVGAVWGFLAITLLLVALHGLNAFDFGHIVLHGTGVDFAFFWALMFLLVGWFEEFLLRGYAQFTLARGIGFWASAVLLSCMFGTIHLRNEGETWNGAFAVAMMSLFFCLTLRRTRTLWFAVGFHASWDWGEGFFYSVPDSGEIATGHLLSSSLHGPRWLTGGSVGPEGSLLCFVVIAVMWVIFSAIYPSSISTEAASQNGAGND